MDRRAFLGLLPATCILPAVAKANENEPVVKFKGDGGGCVGMHIAGDPIAIQYLLYVDEYASKASSEFGERYMRPFEECLEISEQCVDDFRRSIMGYLGCVFLKKGKFEISDCPQLTKACKMIREHKLGEVRDGEIFLFSPPEHLFS